MAHDICQIKQLTLIVSHQVHNCERFIRQHPLLSLAITTPELRAGV